jgi:uncharacterized membrane protein
MSTITKSIEVEAPLETVYNQWTQFEEFPHFMEGVEQVQQLDDRRTHWVTRVGGVRREFDAEIDVQEPDRRIAWSALTGPTQAGEVTFAPVDPLRTQITLTIDWDPQGAVESAGDKLGLVERRVQGDLERFREFIQARGTETGAWRGSVNDPETDLPTTDGDILGDQGPVSGRP